MKTVLLPIRALLCLLAFLAGAAQAHKPSDSYLSLEADAGELRGQWDIALRDFEHAIGLDANGDGEITWGELRAKHPEIAAYALARLSVKSAGAACTLKPTSQLVDEHSDGAYAVLRFAADCGDRPLREVDLEYSLFADLDPTHRGLVRARLGDRTSTAVLGPDRPRLALGADERSALEQFRDYLREGAWHIWIGFDHVLFLISLLLPAVMAATRFAPVFWDVFRIVTAFTIAHSITLALAALGAVELPSRFVESVIALSVVLAALNNLVPLVQRRRWMVAFVFGLVHGFGFASVLADLGLPRENLLLALVGFNLGVEGGQLAIVALFLPLAYAIRHTWMYRRMIFAGGSAAIVLVAGLWMVERMFGLDLGLI